MTRTFQQARKKKQRRNEQDGASGTDGDAAGKQHSRQPCWGSYNPVEKKNNAFENYYKKQCIVPPEDWDKFMSSLRDELPVTFRITGYKSHAQHMLSYLKGHYISELMDTVVDGVKCERPKPMPWYPDELAWQLSATRKSIRKMPEYKKLHDFLVSETESGNISRQEAVSMIPPLLLDVKPQHKVLDMCAAPGSKTAQLIELVHAEQVYGWPEGFVVANDSDNKRCYIMVHQAKRLNSPCCMIVNHDATVFPTIRVPLAGGDGSKTAGLKYDRILCDVPCSGDGTLRKNFLIWKKWTLNSGLNLHILQHRILQRGAELLEVGGRLVYSTCSFNPIENEAVVASVLQKCKGTMELVDVSADLPGLIRQPGLTHWKVIDDAGEVYEALEDVPEDKRSRFKPSLWPPTQEEAESLNIRRCIRVCPHHQDTGGFFVAVLRKVACLPWMKQSPPKEGQGQEVASMEAPDEAASAEELPEVQAGEEEVSMELEPAAEEAPREDEEGAPPPMKKRKGFQGYKEDPFVFFKGSEEIWPGIKTFFQVDDDFPVTQLLTRCHGGKKRNLYFVNQGIKSILQHNENSLKVINSGVKLWSRSDAKDVPCDFRLAQEGIYSLFPHLASVRKIPSMTNGDVRTLLTEENPFCSKLAPAARKAAQAASQGSLIFVYNPKESDPSSNNLPLILVGWRGKNSVRCYIAKGERQHMLRMCEVDDANESPAAAEDGDNGESNEKGAPTVSVDADASPAVKDVDAGTVS